MLTKELVRVRCIGDAVKPQFIRTDDPEILRMSEDLLRLYCDGVGSTAESLEEMAEACLASCRDRKLARGLHKIVRDRATFLPSEECDFPEERTKLFLHCAEILRDGDLPERPEDARAFLFRGMEDSPLVREIYGDLPERERMRGMKKTFLHEIPERYNMGLAQSLLLFASELTAVIPAKEDPAELRRLFRWLRFFRLMFRGRMDGGCMRLTIDGPASVLENSVKYGFQFASFFPALCLLKEWKISCRVNWNGKMRRFSLDQTSGLKSHYSNYGAYRPEEFSMFLDLFRKMRPDWIADDAPNWIRAGGQDLIFPDFSFQNADGRHASLELFHRWHASAAEERLAWCEAHPEQPLLIGFDRSLLKKDGAFKARVENSEFFRTRGFLFRDFPGVEAVSKLLDGLPDVKASHAKNRKT